MKQTAQGKTVRTDALVRRLFFLCGVVTLALTAALTLLFLVGGVWGIAKTGVDSFLLGAPATRSIGLLPLLVSAIYAAGGAVLISAPLGILAAVFFQYSQMRRFVALVRRFFRFMASLPGMVYAVVAVSTLMPFLQARWGIAQGRSLLTAILLLSVLMLPEIILGSMRVLGRGQRDLELAALCLGADHIGAVFRVCLSGARYDLCCVVLQAVGKAASQTLTLITVAGVIVRWPSLLLPDTLMSGGVFLAVEGGNLPLALGLAMVLFLLFFALQALLRALRRDKSLHTLNQTHGGRLP